jgi:hypothetical protein
VRERGWRCYRNANEEERKKERERREKEREGERNIILTYKGLSSIEHG